MMPAQLVPDIMTQHFIDELKVFCSFHAEGCCWMWQLDARLDLGLFAMLDCSSEEQIMHLEVTQ